MTTSWLHLNYTTTIENCLNSSWTEHSQLTTYRKSHLDNGRGAEVQIRLVPHPRSMEVKNQEGNQSWRSPLEEQVVPAPPASPTQGLSAGKGSPHKFWRLGLHETEVPGIPLKMPVNDGLCCSELHCWCSSLKATRDIWGGTNCMVSGQELEGQLSFRQKCWQEALLLALLCPSVTQRANTDCSYCWVSINLADWHCLSHPGDFLRPWPSQLAGPSKPFPVAYP